MTMLWSPDPDFKRATRPSGLHAVLDSQRGERYQAGVPAADAISPVERGRIWLATHPGALGFVCGVIGAVASWALVESALRFLALPDGAQRQAVVALVLVPGVATIAAWAWRRLR